MSMPLFSYIQIQTLSHQGVFTGLIERTQLGEAERVVNVRLTHNREWRDPQEYG